MVETEGDTMISENRLILLQVSRMSYYIVMFISFVATLMYHEKIMTFVAGYTPSNIPAFGVKLLGYLATYMVAIVLLPELLAYIYRKAFLENQV